MVSCITISSSDDEDGHTSPPPQKRARTGGTATQDDEDMEILDANPDAEAAAQRNTAQAGSDSDDDMMVTGATGVVATRDMPHARCHCGVNTFEPVAVAQSHAKTCANCYCYVCDVEATECADWGNGKGKLDHCHANDKSAVWQGKRAEKKRADQAKANPAPTNAGGQAYVHGVPQAQNPYGAPGGGMPAQGNFAGGTTGATVQTWTAADMNRELPDPRVDKQSLFHLGTLQLDVRINSHGSYGQASPFPGGQIPSLTDIAARLAKYGFHFGLGLPHRHQGSRPRRSSKQLDIGGLNGFLQMERVRRARIPHVEAPLPALRPIFLTVVSAKHKSRKYILEVPVRCKFSAVRAAANAAAKAMIGKSETLLISTVPTFRSYSRFTSNPALSLSEDGGARTPDSVYSYLGRVVPSSIVTPQCTVSNKAIAAVPGQLGSHASEVSTGIQVHVLIRTRKIKPTESSYNLDGPKNNNLLVGAAISGAYTVDASTMMEKCHDWVFEHVAHPMLLPKPKHELSAVEASKAIHKAAVEALLPIGSTEAEMLKASRLYGCTQYEQRPASLFERTRTETAYVYDAAAAAGHAGGYGGYGGYGGHHNHQKVTRDVHWAKYPVAFLVFEKFTKIGIPSSGKLPFSRKSPGLFKRPASNSTSAAFEDAQKVNTGIEAQSRRLRAQKSIAEDLYNALVSELKMPSPVDALDYPKMRSVCLVEKRPGSDDPAEATLSVALYARIPDGPQALPQSLAVRPLLVDLNSTAWLLARVKGTRNRLRVDENSCEARIMREIALDSSEGVKIADAVRTRLKLQTPAQVKQAKDAAEKREKNRLADEKAAAAGGKDGAGPSTGGAGPSTGGGGAGPSTGSGGAGPSTGSGGAESMGGALAAAKASAAAIGRALSPLLGGKADGEDTSMSDQDSDDDMPTAQPQLYGGPASASGSGAGGSTADVPFQDDYGSGHSRHSDGGSVTLKDLMEMCVTGERGAVKQPVGLSIKMRDYQLQSLAWGLEQEKREGGLRSIIWREIKTAGGRTVFYSEDLGALCDKPPACPRGGFLAEAMGMGKTIITLGLILANPAPALPDPPEGKTAAQIVKQRIESDQHVKSRATLVVCAVSLVGQWIDEAKSKLDDEHPLRIYMYHGQGRIRHVQTLAEDYDLVVTTYATLATDFSKRNKTSENSPSTGKVKLAGLHPLGAIEWHRVLLDESHTVKEPSGSQSKACKALKGDLRWCASGTPINNGIQDLFGQLSFLGAGPLDTKHAFDVALRLRFDASGAANARDSRKICSLLSRCMVRHTQQQMFGDGAELVKLPAKDDVDVPVTLSKEERKKYDELSKKAKAAFEEIRQGGPQNVARNIWAIQAFLLPLRRLCSGGALSSRDLKAPETAAERAARMAALNPPPPVVGGSGAGAATAKAEVKPKVDKGKTKASPPKPKAPPKRKATGADDWTPTGDDGVERKPVPHAPADTECAICAELLDDPSRTPCCQTWFCTECVSAELARASPSKCPKCNKGLTVTALQQPTGTPDATPAASGQTGGALPKPTPVKAAAPKGRGARSKDKAAAVDKDAPPAFVSESKLAALIKELKAMKEKDPSSKALVFTQYQGTLTWLQQKLKEQGFGHRTISGSMPLKQRDKAIQAFQKDPPTTVFLLSMRSGAVGINLTSANYVFLVEPCLNTALEAQAVGRAWRIGQERVVHIRRLYVKDSVESQIRAVVEARSKGKDDKDDATAANQLAAAGGGRGAQRTGTLDLAGSLKADKQLLRTEEMDVLFKY